MESDRGGRLGCYKCHNLKLVAIQAPQNHKTKEEGKTIYWRVKNAKMQRTWEIRTMWKMRVETAKFNAKKKQNLNTMQVIKEQPKLRRLYIHCYEYWKAVVTATGQYGSRGSCCDLLWLAQLNWWKETGKNTCKIMDLYTSQKLLKNTS